MEQAAAAFEMEFANPVAGEAGDGSSKEASPLIPECLADDDGADTKQLRSAMWLLRQAQVSAMDLQEAENRQRQAAEDREKMAKEHIISPDSGFRKKWDLAQVLYDG